MNIRSGKENKYKQLQALAVDPEEQVAFAITLLQPVERHDYLLAALQVLADNPSLEAYDPLVAVYHHLAMDGLKRDPGTFVRSAALNALRPIARNTDVPFLLQAAETYEFMPPDFRDEASALRAAALLMLNELDDESASYYAARFLVDGHTAPMSGEPALTAVRVLASRNEPLVLYQYVMKSSGSIMPEVSSECLRNLITLPKVMIPGVVATVEKRSSPVELLGLFDLLIGHESGPQMLNYIDSYLREPDDLDLYRYVVLTAANARRDELVQLVCEVALDEIDEDRLEILIAALEPFAADEQVRDTLEQITPD